MEVQFAMVCDCANATGNGKLNVMGEFDNIWSTEFPCHHPQMYYAAKILLSAGDPDEVALELRIVGEDGELAAQPLPLQLGRTPGRPADGERPAARLVLQVLGAQFKQPGTYCFELHSGGRALHSVELHIKYRAPG